MEEPRCAGCMPKDSCYEARTQAPLINGFAAREADLLKAFSEISGNCRTGKYHPSCVARAYIADWPTKALHSCMDTVGPAPVHIEAVCQQSLGLTGKAAASAHRWASAKWVMDQAYLGCASIPIECFARLHTCATRPNVRYCFNECV